MKEDSVVECRNPGIALPVADALTEVLRNGARELLQQAVEAEVAEFVRSHRELKDEQERQRVVRNGYRPERTIQTGIGEVTVRAPRARDRVPAGGDRRRPPPRSLHGARDRRSRLPAGRTRAAGGARPRRPRARRRAGRIVPGRAPGGRRPAGGPTRDARGRRARSRRGETRRRARGRPSS